MRILSQSPNHAHRVRSKAIQLYIQKEMWGAAVLLYIRSNKTACMPYKAHDLTEEPIAQFAASMVNNERRPAIWIYLTFSISSASSKTKILTNLKLRILFESQFFSVPCVPITTCSVILWFLSSAHHAFSPVPRMQPNGMTVGNSYHNHT